METVSVPSRGIGCIPNGLERYDEIGSFRPLTGHRMHCTQYKSFASPLIVSVPSRGIGCIGKDIHHKIDNRQCFYEKCRRKIPIMSNLPIHLM